MPRQPTSPELQTALKGTRPAFLVLLFFSSTINMLMLAPAIYMLQVYDRVLVSKNTTTLLMLTLLIIGIYTVISMIEFARASVMTRLGNRLDVKPGQKTPTLRNIAFQLDQGEVLGIIGPSASGKTSLAKLLVGVWAPLAGKVRIDGADICHWDKALIGPAIGYLPQEVELFDGSIAQNIARFTQNDSDAIVAAATLAGVHDMILRLPQGYDTPLGANGYQLSGGQRQRIGLARAVYNNPAFIVLDEPNANLDDAGEYALIQTINAVRAQGQTVVMISHRPTLLGVVNKILLLNDGAVQEFGTRDQVFANLRQANILKPVSTASGLNGEPQREAL